MNNLVKEIHENGIALVGNLSTEKLEEFKNYVYNCDWYSSHVNNDETAPVKRLEDSASTHVNMHDVILAPHWFEVALDQTKVVSEYFGTENIFLYSLSVFYTNPIGNSDPRIQEWHRDADSSNFLVLFMYLTDVLKSEDGPHGFEKKNGERIFVYGPAGTMFFADTRQMHMGKKPLNSSRGIAWARWSGVPEIGTYEPDKLSPIDKNLLGSRYPTDEVLQKIIQKVAI